MPGGFGQWLQSIGSAFIRAGQSVADAFRSVFSTSESIAGRTPDAGGLRSTLESEQLRQLALQQPGAQSVTDWFTNRGEDVPPAVYQKIPHNQIIQSDWALEQPYGVHMHFGILDAKGNVVSEKWVTLWEPRNKSPGEITDDGDAYWATAGEKYGPKMVALDYEVMEDPQHPDWTP